MRLRRARSTRRVAACADDPALVEVVEAATCRPMADFQRAWRDLVLLRDDSELQAIAEIAVGVVRFVLRDDTPELQRITARIHWTGWLTRRSPRRGRP